jgi:hypothetical protein
LDRRTYAEREELAEKVLDLMWIDPDDFLSEHRSFLDKDFDKLGDADFNAQAYLVAEAKAAFESTSRPRQLKCPSP